MSTSAIHQNTDTQTTDTTTNTPTTNTTRRRITAGALAAAAIAASAIGLAATGHADSATDLQAAIPTPANTQRTDGPGSIADNGIRMHFLVNGSPTSVLDAYKAALEGQGWTVTVTESNSWGGAGGATYIGTRGSTYGVFTGGGPSGTTDINACAWPAKPANTNCGDRR